MLGVRSVLIASFLSAACVAPANPQTRTIHGWTPTLAQVQELETHLTKPGPAQLAKSARYYYGEYEHGRKLIRGEIVPDESGHDATIHITPDFPLIMDGGCSVINFKYDPAKHTMRLFECNGLA